MSCYWTGNRIMASSSSEITSADPTSDLTTLISKGTADVEVLKLYAEKGQLDIPDKDGKTPLMFACLKGLEDNVKFLLANGANPNSKCFKEGNTPMHYACIVEDLKEEDALSRRNYNPSKWMTSKIAVIKLLLSSGALAVQDNLNGWSPPCVAALYILKGVVDFFLAMDDADILLEEKIKATEILGVSQATLDHDYDRVFEDAFYAFSRAIGFRQGAMLPKAQSETSELAACFSKISLQECHTLEEMKSIKQSEVSMKAHAFLVGDRLFPKNLKQKYLYPSLATFGSDLMCDQRLGKGLQVLLCALRFQHRGEIKLGLVVENVAEISELLVADGYDNKDPSHQSLRYVRDLLCECESVLNHVHIDSLSDHSDSLLESFGRTLYGEAFYCSAVDILKSTLQTIKRSVRVIRGRIRKENPDKYHELSSVTFTVMDILADEFVGSKRTGRHVPSRSLLRVKFVIRKILFFESASYRVRNHGDTLLHLVAYSVSDPRHLEHLEDLALAFVRHGCPIDVVNENGETARDILVREDVYHPVGDPRFLTLVSPPTTVLTLEEIAIRQILQKGIGYLGEVPTCLCEMIEGGLKDSDLERANDESGSGEERDWRQ